MKRISRIRIDLAAINASFLMNFSAYYSMQGLQSSLNKSIGTQSLCALFTSLTISAMFVPPIVITKIGERRTMALGTLTYSLFTLANCYPRSYTLIPAAITMGTGAAILWSAVRGYIRVKSVEYSTLDGSDKDAKTTHIFGVFMAFLSASLLIGNVMSSVIFQSISTDKQRNMSSTNISGGTNDEMQWNSSTNSANLHCGMHNCDYESKDLVKNLTVTAEIVEQVVVNSPVPYILFGVFASLQTAAALILVCALTELGDVNDRSKQTTKETESPMIVNNTARKPAATQIIAKQLMATIKLNVSNKTARLLIPITLDIGVVEGFVMGQLTRDWMTCYMGIQYVGYGVCVFGIGSIVASYGCGILSYRISRQSMLLVVLVLEMASSLYLLFWEPNVLTDSWIFYVTFCIYGIIYTSRKTLINASYTIFFQSDIEAANSSTTMWGATGAALAFAVSPIICNRVYVIILLVLALIGTGMYVFAERTRDKPHQRKVEEFQIVEQEHT